MHKTQAEKKLAAETKKKRKRSGKKGRKFGRNKVKCEKYRMRVGKPNGPGMPGNKRH